ncbi:MAG: thymidylate synthase [Candidatus Levybacteria bacterium]|nr:thymidylate synthase [Candidatus Levybacteria bacterium]
MKKNHLKDTERSRSAEYQYLNLLQDILDNGVEKVDRGTDVKLYSVFGRQIRFDLSKGFPLLTTKKVYWKGVLYELYWFMSGQTNIKYLVDNNVHIWDDYPYKIYKAREGKPFSVIARSKATKQSPKIATAASDAALAMTNNKLLTKEEFVQKIKDDEEFAKEHGNLPRIYGEMWRRWPTHSSQSSSGQARTIDQLAWVIQELKDDPDAKNLIVNSWNPEYLYTMATNEDASRFPICHNMYQINQRDGKLSLQLYHRSADIFLGVPFNIASYALLTIILARVTGYEPGEFIHTFGDVHIYENHIEAVKEQLQREPKPFPTVKIDPSVKKLDDFRPEHVILENYDPHPVIKAELTIAGGLYDPKTGKMAS